MPERLLLHYIHLPVCAEHHIFRDVASQTFVCDNYRILNSTRGRQVAGKVVGLDITKYQTMGAKLTSKNTGPWDMFIRGLIFLRNSYEELLSAENTLG